MKKTVLGGILALSVALASCGGPTTPAPSTGTTPKPAPAPGPGPVADAPEDATAAREFVFSKRQTRALAQSLSLGPLDAVDLGERLRVVLTVSRAKSGANIGKKKATATFIWGNQSVNLAGTYTLGVGAFGSTGALKATDGKLALAVKSPDFQAKAGRSTAYVEDTGEMCARLTFNLSAGSNAWSSNTPVEVCEGTGTRDAEEKALTTFSRGLLYTDGGGSLAGSPWTFERVSEQPADRMPTAAELLAARGLPAYITVKTETFREFVYNHLSIYEMTSKERRAWEGFLRQFEIYYREVQVYRIRIADDRELVYVLGRNSSGLSGMSALRFTDGSEEGGAPDVQLYPSLGRYGGSLFGSVEIGPHVVGATVSGRYALRQSSTCSAGAGVTLDRALIPAQVVEFGNGLASTRFEIEAIPEPETTMVMDYALTVTASGKSQTYTGFSCSNYVPSEPEPSSLPPAPATLAESMMDSRLVAEVSPNGDRQYHAEVVVLPPIGATVSGSYVIRDMAECGSYGRQTYFQGVYALSEPAWFPDAYMLTAQTGPVVGAGAGMVYDVTAQHGGESRRWEGYTCWQEVQTVPVTGPIIGRSSP